VVTIIRQVEELFEGHPQVEIELEDGTRQFCAYDDADWAIRQSVQLGFDPQWVKDQLEVAEWEELDEYSHIKSVYLGTVFALCPSGKYYQPWASNNIELCPFCNGQGLINNVHFDPELFKFWSDVDRAMRQGIIDTFGFFHGNGWPKEAIDMLEQTQAYVDLYRDHTPCPQCGSLGSAEAYLDQIWQEKCEALYDKYGFCIESGEGDPCDILAVVSEDYDESEDNQ